MAVVLVDDDDYRGLSTDTKPTAGVESGSTFRELDTGIAYEFSAENINPATTNGWWVI